MVTNQNPYSNSKYTDAFKKLTGMDWTGSFNYVSNSMIYQAATGKANLLFGDGSVHTKHASWIFSNRLELFTNK